MLLKLLRCYVTEVLSVIFKLNNFFIKCTLLFADGFLYIPDRASINLVVDFSFIMLYATFLDKDN
jgi:hypothetical protein